MLRCDNFVEQREHSRMSSHVIDMHERGHAVVWSECVVGKLVRCIVVTSELIGRRNHRA